MVAVTSGRSYYIHLKVIIDKCYIKIVKRMIGIMVINDVENVKIEVLNFIKFYKWVGL